MSSSSSITTFTTTVYHIMLDIMALLFACLIVGSLWAVIVLAASQIFPVLLYGLEVMNMIKSFLLGH